MAKHCYKLLNIVFYFKNKKLFYKIIGKKKKNVKFKNNCGNKSLWKLSSKATCINFGLELSSKLTLRNLNLRD